MINLSIFIEFFDRIRVVQIDFHAFCTTSAAREFRFDACGHMHGSELVSHKWFYHTALLLDLSESLVFLELILEGLDNMRMKSLEITINLFYFDGLHSFLLAPTDNRRVLNIECFKVDVDRIVRFWLLVLIKLNLIIFHSYLCEIFINSELQDIIKLFTNLRTHISSEILAEDALFLQNWSEPLKLDKS